MICMGGSKIMPNGITPTMSAVIKDYLYTLRQRDKYQQQIQRRNSETDNFGQWPLGVNGRLSREEIYG